MWPINEAISNRYQWLWFNTTGQYATADFIEKVLSVYTHSMTTIYQSMSAEVAKSTFFMKSLVEAGLHDRNRKRGVGLDPELSVL